MVAADKGCGAASFSTSSGRSASCRISPAELGGRRPHRQACRPCRRLCRSQADREGPCLSGRRPMPAAPEPALTVSPCRLQPHPHRGSLRSLPAAEAPGGWPRDRRPPVQAHRQQEKDDRPDTIRHPAPGTASLMPSWFQPRPRDLPIRRRSSVAGRAGRSRREGSRPPPAPPRQDRSSRPLGP